MISDDIEFIVPRPNDPDVICPDVSRIRSALGREPKVTLSVGLRATLDYVENEIPWGKDRTLRPVRAISSERGLKKIKPDEIAIHINHSNIKK